MRFFKFCDIITSKKEILFFLSKFRRGCTTSEDILWKLDALQAFIRELHWV